MKNYQTKQRELLLNFMQKNCKELFSAEEIYNNLCGEISESAVYRNLEKLSLDGEIIKEAAAEGKKCMFRYNQAANCSGHLHLHCRVCGKTIHLSEKASEQFVSEIMNDKGFCVDENSAVINGICKACKNK